MTSATTTPGPDLETNSTQAERDMRNLHAHDGKKIAPGEIAIGVIIGRTSEFFDFFVYAIASCIVTLSSVDLSPVSCRMIDRTMGNVELGRTLCAAM